MLFRIRSNEGIELERNVEAHQVQLYGSVHHPFQFKSAMVGIGYLLTTPIVSFTLHILLIFLIRFKYHVCSYHRKEDGKS